MSRSILIKIFLLALAVRMIYSLAVPAIFFNVDTEGYYNIGMQFFRHPTLRTLITPYRTPAYPLFLNGVFSLFGVGGAPYASTAFLWGAQFVVAIQMIIGALAFTAFYHAITRVLSKRARLTFAIFLLFDVFVIGWERTLLTQGLAISLSLMATAVIFSMLFRPAGKKFILLCVLCAFGFFLRPQFIILPIVSLPIVAWFFRKQGRTVFFACVSLAVICVLPLMYARIDYINYKYFGLQFGGDIATLGRILELHIPVESAKNNTYFYTVVNDSRATNHLTMPFRFLEHYDPDIYGKVDRMVQLQAFNQTVILHSLPLFVVRSMGTLPEVLLEVCDFTLAPPGSTHPLTRIVWILQKLYGYAQYATLAVPFLWIPMCILFFVKPTRWNAIVALTGTIAMSQIALTALTMYHDTGEQYARIISLVRPQMFLFLFLSTLTFIRIYRKRQI